MAPKQTRCFWECLDPPLDHHAVGVVITPHVSDRDMGQRIWAWTIAPIGPAWAGIGIWPFARRPVNPGFSLFIGIELATKQRWIISFMGYANLVGAGRERV